MTQEEKSKANDGNYKAYTELINRLEDVKDAIKKQNYGIAMDILCKPYPDYQITASTELKESEDERIRKALINGFNKLDKSAVWYNGITNGQILAWLEAQGEHAKFRDSIQVGDKVTCNEDGVLVNLSQLKRVAKPAEKQGSQILANSEKTCKDERKPAENKGTNLAEEEMTPFQKKVFCIVDTAIEEEQGLSNICNELLALAKQEIEQKPWSEEDKYNCNIILSLLNNECVGRADKRIAIEWFKSLKDRVGCEVNCTTTKEWNDEDESRITVICTYLQDYARLSGSESRTIRINEYCDWLKSLKDRVQPQPKHGWSEEDKKIIDRIESEFLALHRGDYKNIDFNNVDNLSVLNWVRKIKFHCFLSRWKPSDEQMNTLEYYMHTLVCNEHKEILFGLYSCLKKLRE